jgi:5-(carboxyamino)imidazole ribonucleotide mutase
MGSDSDLPVMAPAAETLTQFGIAHEVRILSAHRTPAQAARFAKGARARGVRVIIAAAGGAAHLAGATAAHTTLPVIGVPIMTKALHGVDSYLSTLQMPSGVPVATVAINGAKNAAILAAQILAVSDPRVARLLSDEKQRMAKEVLRKSRQRVSP